MRERSHMVPFKYVVNIIINKISLLSEYEFNIYYLKIRFVKFMNYLLLFSIDYKH